MIIEMLTMFLPIDMKFSSSGREDVDVRMLGRGRPFMFELVNPRRVHLSQQEVSDIETAINESSKDVFVRDLQVVSKYFFLHPMRCGALVSHC